MRRITRFWIVNTLIFVIVVLPLIFLNLKYSLKESFDITFTTLQMGAIIIGGFWAYEKFFWETRVNKIINLREILSIYEWKHRLSAAEYRSSSATESEENRFMKYKKSILIPYKQLQSGIRSISCYIPTKLRKEISDTIIIQINCRRESLDNDWTVFGEKMKDVYKKLDDLVN